VGLAGCGVEWRPGLLHREGGREGGRGAEERASPEVGLRLRKIGAEEGKDVFIKGCGGSTMSYIVAPGRQRPFLSSVPKWKRRDRRQSTK